MWLLYIYMGAPGNRPLYGIRALNRLLVLSLCNRYMVKRGSPAVGAGTVHVLGPYALVGTRCRRSQCSPSLMPCC